MMRGHIKLIDLQDMACEWYQTIKLNYDALLHSKSDKSYIEERRSLRQSRPGTWAGPQFRSLIVLFLSRRLRL
jgi:hypothetical protein